MCMINNSLVYSIRSDQGLDVYYLDGKNYEASTTVFSLRDTVLQACWSPCGTIVAVNTTTNGVSLYKNACWTSANITINPLIVPGVGRPSCADPQTLKHMQWSPLGTHFVCFWKMDQRTTNETKSNSKKESRNVFVWKIIDSSDGHPTEPPIAMKQLTAFTLKGVTLGQWPILRWRNDERYCCVTSRSEVVVYDGCDVGGTALLRVSLTGVIMSEPAPCVDKTLADQLTFAAFYPDAKAGRFYVVRITDMADKKWCTTVEQNLQDVDSAKLQWNASGSTLLALVSATVDTAGQNYGEVGHAYLANADGSSTFKVNEKVVQEASWNPVKNEFVLIEGKCPSDITLYDEKGTVLQRLSQAYCNTLCWDPFGRMLAVGGFGNLAGDIRFWYRDPDAHNKEPARLIHQWREPCTVLCNWSPCGTHFFTACTFPRMRVDNYCKIFTYEGTLVQHLHYSKLFDLQWKPSSSLDKKKTRQSSVPVILPRLPSRSAEHPDGNTANNGVRDLWKQDQEFEACNGWTIWRSQHSLNQNAVNPTHPQNAFVCREPQQNVHLKPSHLEFVTPPVTSNRASLEAPTKFSCDSNNVIQAPPCSRVSHNINPSQSVTVSPDQEPELVNLLKKVLPEAKIHIAPLGGVSNASRFTHPVNPAPPVRGHPNVQRESSVVSQLLLDPRKPAQDVDCRDSALASMLRNLKGCRTPSSRVNQNDCRTVAHFPSDSSREAYPAYCTDMGYNSDMYYNHHSFDTLMDSHVHSPLTSHYPQDNCTPFPLNENPSSLNCVRPLSEDEDLSGKGSSRLSADAPTFLPEFLSRKSSLSLNPHHAPRESHTYSNFPNPNPPTSSEFLSFSDILGRTQRIDNDGLPNSLPEDNKDISMNRFFSNDYSTSVLFHDNLSSLHSILPELHQNVDVPVENPTMKLRRPQPYPPLFRKGLNHNDDSAQTCRISSFNDTMSCTLEYLDPQGQVQGPFSLASMKEWLALGYFTPSLLVRCLPSKEFVPFAKVLRIRD